MDGRSAQRRRGRCAYWLLSDKQDGGTLYPDYDGYTVYCPTPVCTMFTNFARRIEDLRPFSSAPVADDDATTTPNGTPVTLNVAANDVTYQTRTSTSIPPISIRRRPVASSR